MRKQLGQEQLGTFRIVPILKYYNVLKIFIFNDPKYNI